MADSSMGVSIAFTLRLLDPLLVYLSLAQVQACVHTHMSRPVPLSQTLAFPVMYNLGYEAAMMSVRSGQLRIGR